jgi:Transglycosylase-like domain
MLTMVVGLSAVAGATPGQATPVAGARAALDAATQVRVAAKLRLQRLEATRADLQAKLARGSAESNAVTTQMVAARHEALQRAVDAYVNGDDSEQLAVFLRSTALTDAAARTSLLADQTHSAVEAAVTFQRMKESNEPAVVDLATHLDGIEADIADARSDLYQAEALEADAEHGLTAAIQAAAAASTRAATARLTSAGTRQRAAGPKGSTAAAPTGPKDAWSSLRDCESGGDYGAVSASGRYGGAYQFDQGTWDSIAVQVDPSYVGVDPAAAPAAVQDEMAQALYGQRGTRPWPRCGHHLP